MAWAALVGDTVDLVPFVTGAGETIKAINTIEKTVNSGGDVIDTAKSLKLSKTIKKSSGSYEITFKSGNSYIGKGGFKRAIKSATDKATTYKDPVTSIRWKSAHSSRDAFIDEYYMQKRFGGVNNNGKNKTLKTYNKIWSPGRRYAGIQM